MNENGRGTDGKYDEGTNEVRWEGKGISGEDKRVESISRGFKNAKRAGAVLC